MAIKGLTLSELHDQQGQVILSDNDLVYIVDNSAGSCQSKAITLAELKSYIGSTPGPSPSTNVKSITDLNINTGASEYGAWTKRPDIGDTSLEYIYTIYSAKAILCIYEQDGQVEAQCVPSEIRPSRLFDGGIELVFTINNEYKDLFSGFNWTIKYL